ncbi:hypothetical protein DIPPA_51156 [Diplonema papillatum]|nr:hypothetical protein DIPPA_51156 [Diplonema papillatum]
MRRTLFLAARRSGPVPAKQRYAPSNQLVVAQEHEVRLRWKKDRRDMAKRGEIGRKPKLTASKLNLRSHVRQALEDYGAGTVQEVIDRFNNPAVPASEKPPEDLMRLLVNLETRDLSPESQVGPPRKGDSFVTRSLVGARTYSATANRLVEGEGHGGEKQSAAMWVNRSPVSKEHVAPLRYASTKAKYLFGKHAFVDIVYQVPIFRDIPPPDPNVPEVAFIGPANYGKSTLINTVLNRHVLPSGPEQSSTEDFTFVQTGAKSGSLRIVDTPGWLGPVTAIHAGSLPAKIDDALRRFLLGRSGSKLLKAVFIMIPGEAGLDYGVKLYMNMLMEFDIPFWLVIHRTDQLYVRKLKLVVTQIELEIKDYPLCRGILLTSAVQKLGISKLQNVLAESSRIPELGHTTTVGFDISSILPPTGFAQFLEGTQTTTPNDTYRKSWQRYQTAKESSEPWGWKSTETSRRFLLGKR